VPTFTWLHRQFSPDGVPLLSINFHDGKPDDVAVLKQINPIPRQPKEREENIDNCIFGGFLQMETTVYVTLTGGCPFEDNFEVKNSIFNLDFQELGCGHAYYLLLNKVYVSWS
jgi:hypothetical protein